MPRRAGQSADRVRTECGQCGHERQSADRFCPCPELLPLPTYTAAATGHKCRHHAESRSHRVAAVPRAYTSPRPATTWPQTTAAESPESMSGRGGQTASLSPEASPTLCPPLSVPRAPREHSRKPCCADALRAGRWPSGQDAAAGSAEVQVRLWQPSDSAAPKKCLFGPFCP
jgi:hypothetical protein